jgi:DnaJ family protein C protein 28
MRLDLLAEERIRAAMDEGAFDELQRRGQPLTLRSATFIDKKWRLAYHVMRNAGMAPRWIELNRDIREQLEQASEASSFALAAFAASKPARSRAIGRFRRVVADAKCLIQQLNLLIPSDRFGRPLIDAAREIVQIQLAEDGESS